jgi:hypothetical protein
MFRALLAHPQEALHKRHLVYCVRIMSVGCATIAVSLILNKSLNHLILNKLNKSASRWFHYTDVI